MSSWFETYGDRYFGGLDMKLLKIDEAWLTINISSITSPAYLYQLHKRCLNCDYYLADEKLDIPMIYSRPIKSTYKYIIKNEENATMCAFDSIGEFGVYSANINNSLCDFQVLKKPVNEYLPILTTFLIYLAIYAIMYLTFFLVKKLWFKSENNDDDSKPPKRERVKSLDTFRGIAIVIMIFVNLGAGGYEVLDHSTWNGLQLADFPFPWFLWIMGMCIPISITSAFKRNTSNKTVMWNLTKRSIKLFCLGIFLDSGVYLDKLRVFGVLQRLSIGYFVGTTLLLYLMKRDIPEQKSFRRHFIDLEKTAICWVVILLIEAVHLLIIFLVADHRCPRGYLGPGGLHDHGKYEGCTGGATGYLDRAILGHHVYQLPTCIEAYQSQPFDPEGIIGCLNTIVHAFIGIQGGIILMTYKSPKDRLIRWTGWALLTGLIGGILCRFSKEDGVIPINKNMWSLSYVLVTSCFAYLLFSFCYIIVDIKKWWSGKPFFYAGMNSMYLYIGHMMTGNNFPVGWIFNSNVNSTHFMLLLQCVSGTTIWVLAAMYLYKINYFLII